MRAQAQTKENKSKQEALKTRSEKDPKDTKLSLKQLILLPGSLPPCLGDSERGDVISIQTPKADTQGLLESPFSHVPEFT